MAARLWMDDYFAKCHLPTPLPSSSYPHLDPRTWTNLANLGEMKNKENLHLCHHPHLSLDLFVLGTYHVKLRGDLFKLGQRRVEQTLSIFTTTIPIFVPKPDRSCQTRVISLLIFFVLGTDLVKLGRVEQTRSNVVTVGHSQIWTSLTQLRPNWYLDRRPLASHYKNNPSQISPSSVLLEWWWWSTFHSCLNNNGWVFHRTPQVRENYDCCAITMIVSVHITRRGPLKQGEQLKLVASGHFAFLPGLKCWAAR